MGIADLLFPKTCLGCGREGSFVCASCMGKMALLKQVCPECNRPSVDGFTHVKCKRPWGLDGLVLLWPYGGVVRKAILKLKYNYATAIAEDLAAEIVSVLRSKKTVLPKNILLTPVPVHWMRGNMRGFNQSEEVGRLIVGKMDWKVIPDLVVRKSNTVPQTSLKRKDRLSNVRGAFVLNPKYSLSKLLTTNYQLLIFDDVWTTGSTIREVAKVLKRKGIKSVWGMAIAR